MGLPSLLVSALLSLQLSQSAAQTVEVSMILAGIVTCTNASISDAITYAVIPQAKVDFVCGVFLFERVVKSTTASYLGIYTLSFTPTDILLTNPELCHLRVTFPASSCSFDRPGGVLRFPILGIRSSSGTLIDYIPGIATYLP